MGNIFNLHPPSPLPPPKKQKVIDNIRESFWIKDKSCLIGPKKEQEELLEWLYLCIPCKDVCRSILQFVPYCQVGDYLLVRPNAYDYKKYVVLVKEITDSSVRFHSPGSNMNDYSTELSWKEKFLEFVYRPEHSYFLDIKKSMEKGNLQQATVVLLLLEEERLEASYRMLKKLAIQGMFTNLCLPLEFSVFEMDQHTMDKLTLRFTQEQDKLQIEIKDHVYVGFKAKISSEKNEPSIPPPVF